MQPVKTARSIRAWLALALLLGPVSVHAQPPVAVPAVPVPVPPPVAVPVPAVSPADAVTRARLDTLLTTAAGTPEAKGLVPTALTEARLVVAHAQRAAEAPTDLLAMQAAAAQVLHAIDPARSALRAPGYGVARAIAETVREVQLAVATDRRGDVTRAAPKILTAAKQAQGAAAALAATAEQILAARTAAAAAPLATTLATQALQLLVGPAGKPGPAMGGLAALQAHLAGVYAGRARALPAVLTTERPR